MEFAALPAQLRISMRSCAGALRCSKFCAHQCVYILWKCSRALCIYFDALVRRVSPVWASTLLEATNAASTTKPRPRMRDFEEVAALPDPSDNHVPGSSRELLNTVFSG